jgi:hypothetical protein
MRIYGGKIVNKVVQGCRSKDESTMMSATDVCPARALGLWFTAVLYCTLTSRMVLGAEGARLQDVERAYVGTYRRITTLLVEGDKTIEPAIPLEEWGKLRASPGIVATHFVIVIHRDGRLYTQFASPIELLSRELPKLLRAKHPETKGKPFSFSDYPQAEIQQLANDVLAKSNVECRGSTEIYDGAKVWRNNADNTLRMRDKESQAFIVFDVTKPGDYLGETFLDWSLLSFEIPSVASVRERRARNRVPATFAWGGRKCAITTEVLDGVSCVVCDFGGAERIWLDPALDFAVRRREFFRKGMPVFEHRVVSLKRASDGPWIPSEVVETEYGRDWEAKGRYYGKPVSRARFRVSRIERDLPEHIRYLSIDVPAGSWVIDETLKPLDASGKISKTKDSQVSYVQPANAADLEKIVQLAQLRAGNEALSVVDKPASSRPNRIIWMIGLNVVVLICLVGTLWLWRRRHT